jgi:putative DNA primase/helicase
MDIKNFSKLNAEEKNVIINKYKTQIEHLSNKVINLSVPYNDISVLLENTQELELVNYFFKSISCGDKGIETLLYEVIGYSLLKTAQLNKAFIFKGKGRNGKSKIFRILEALLVNKCSHEHLEQLSGSKSGGKSSIEKLTRIYG